MRFGAVSLVLLGAVVAACGDGGGFPDAANKDTVPFYGHFELQWSLTDGGGTAVTCAQAGAQSVVAIVTDTAPGHSSFNEVFMCSAAAGNSDDILPDTYDMTFKLTDASNATLATVPDQDNVTIVGNKFTVLTPVVFAVATAP